MAKLRLQALIHTAAAKVTSSLALAPSLRAVTRWLPPYRIGSQKIWRARKA